jgi:hypothetical protein
MHVDDCLCGIRRSHAQILYRRYAEDIRLELFVSGFPPQSCCAVYQQSEFIKFHLFHDSLENVLIPNVITWREKLGWVGLVSYFLTGFLDIS